MAFDPTPIAPDGSSPEEELKRQVLNRLGGVDEREVPPPPPPLAPNVAAPTSAPPVQVAPPAPGAWAELLDLLLLMGRPPPRWRTATWIAEDLSVALTSSPPGPSGPPPCRDG